MLKGPTMTCPSRILLKCVAGLLGITAPLWLIMVLPAASAQVLDCHAVDCSRRAACNRNVLKALGDLNIGYRERLREDSGLHKAIAIMQYRQQQLRSFYYDADCASAPKNGPEPSKAPGFWASVSQRWERFRSGLPWWTEYLGTAPPLSQPLHANTCTLASGCPEDEVARAEETARWLVGRWTGWQGSPDNRSIRASFNVIRVIGSHVKACSDQGMVGGTIEPDGSLELPRVSALDADYRFKLWRVRDEEELRGTALLTQDRRRDMVTGPVWLQKTLEAGDASPVPDSCIEETESFRVRR
jgi:hypothetical protein